MGDFKPLKMGQFYESLYINMSSSLQDHADLVGGVSQITVPVIVRALRKMTAIFLVVHYSSFEG